MVDGRPWPVADSETVWMPAGAHTLEAAPASDNSRLLRFTGDLKTARYTNPGALEFSYSSESRAIAVLDRAAVRLTIDGQPAQPETAGPNTILLPRGQHLVTIETSSVTIRSE